MQKETEPHISTNRTSPILCAGEPDEHFFATNPLEHPEWDSLLPLNDLCSVFHSSRWARVLQDSYGHKPVYFCRQSPGELRQLLPVMEISGPLGGRHGISLPFTDVCLPLGDSESVRHLYGAAMEYGRAHDWRYFEYRGGNGERPGAVPSLEYWGHYVDLDSSEEALFARLKVATRRGVRKAQRAQLGIEFSSQTDAMEGFYRLHCATRRRHGVPPQPWLFFENILRLVIQPGHGFVVTASLEKKPIAAAVFFHFGFEAVYKFGASDYNFQHLRGNNLVLWEAIKRYSANGFSRLHLGRTSLANKGLRRFKLGFGAMEEKIRYFKYDFRKQAFVGGVDHSNLWFKPVFRHLPLPLLRWLGAMAYPRLA